MDPAAGGGGGGGGGGAATTPPKSNLYQDIYNLGRAVSPTGQFLPPPAPSVSGTWGPQTGILGYINPFSLDYGATELYRQQTGQTLSGERTTGTNNPAVVQATNTATYSNPNPVPQKTYPTTNDKGETLVGYNANGDPIYSGGGGGGGGSPAPSPSSPTAARPNVGDKISGGPTGVMYWDGNQYVPDYNAPTQINVDREYGNAQGYYDQILNDLRNNKPNYINQFSQPFDALLPGVEAGYQTGNRLLGQQQGEVRQGEQNALSEARRLYNELGQGVQQRFGGRGSASDFANAFYGREFQRQMGNIQNTTGSNISAIQGKQQDLLTQYNAQKQSIDAQKAAAISRAETEFQDRIAAINETRGALEQQKAQMKIQELQNYRSLVAQINQQHEAYAQNLLAQVNQANMGLAQTVAQYQSYAGQPVNVSGLPQWSVPGLTGQGNSPQLTTNVSGYYNPNEKRNTA